MLVAETLSLAALEILRLFAERGMAKGKLEELHSKLLAAAQADQRALEAFIRSELSAQLEAMRAESAARQETLRRELRRLVLGLGAAAIAAAAAGAAMAAWLLRA